MPITSKEIIKILHRDGWKEISDRTRGSHIQLKHCQKRGRVTIPMHSGDLPIGTLKSILHQAGLEFSDYFRNKYWNDCAFWFSYCCCDEL